MQSDFGVVATRRLSRWAAGAAAVGVGVFLVVRLFGLINLYNVNVPFHDHWKYYFVLAEHPGLWTMFTLQHGPHRMGLGLLLSRILTRATRWNMRAEAFTIGACLTASVVLALCLKRRLFGRLAWYDVAIPLIVLTPAQWKIWQPTSIPAASAIPLFLVILYALAFTIRRTGQRCVILAAITFLAVFTGYGLFLGPVTVGLSLVHMAHAIYRRDKRDAILNGGLFVAASCTGLLFLIGYRFNPGVPRFVFPFPQPGMYPYTMALLMGRAIGLLGMNWPVAAMGGLAIVAAAVAWILHVRGAVTLRPRSVAIVALITFSFLYDANSVVGRIAEGLVISTDSHYVTLTIPGLLGIYLACLDVESRIFRLPFLAVVLATAAYGGLMVKGADQKMMKMYASGQQRWIKTYLATHRVDMADQAAGFQLHVNPAKVQLQERLDYLERHRLGFFAEPR